MKSVLPIKKFNNDYGSFDVIKWIIIVLGFSFFNNINNGIKDIK